MSFRHVRENITAIKINYYYCRSNVYWTWDFYDRKMDAPLLDLAELNKFLIVNKKKKLFTFVSDPKILAPRKPTKYL